MKQTQLTIEQKLERFLIHEERLKMTNIPHDAHLSLGGLLDSLSYATMLTFIHKEFGIFVDLSKLTMDQIDTIQKIASLIRKQQAAKKRKR